MAARVGLVAVRDIEPEDFLAAFPMLESSHPSQSAGWTFASFNLFAHGSLAGPRAETALRALGRPSLQAWTEDGALWHLAVYPPTRKLFRHVHWFRYNEVAAGREKPGKSVTLRRYLDQYERGLAEDYRYAGPLPEGPIARAMGEHLRARALALSDALAACGVRHDRAAVRAALTGESVTPEEWSWDVGNLPRLLDAIGLDGAFPGWQEQLEEDRRDAATRREEHRAAMDAGRVRDLVQPILDRLGDAEPRPIRGGPVPASPAALWRVPWACRGDVEIGLIARPARAATFKRPRGLEHLSVAGTADEWRIGHPWCSVWLRSDLFARIGAVLAKLPNGSTLELVSASLPAGDGGGPAVTAGDMRFRGVIERGRWKLTHASPAVSAKALRDALGIFDWIAGRGAYATASAAAARRVAEAARASGDFGAEAKDQPVVSGRGITVRARPMRHLLAMHLFRDRFADGPWDVRSARDSERAEQAEFDGMLEALGSELDRAFAAPREEATVFQGRRSAFRRADILKVRSRLDLADLFRRLYPARDPGASLDLPGAVTRVHEAMTGRGLVSLGDMVCEAFGDIVIRGYARPEGDVYGLTYAGTMGQFIYEFNTRFTDGSSLTTSIHHGQTRKELRLRHAQFPNAPVEELLDHHLAAVEKHTTERVRPEPHPMDLATLAERIDDYLVRTAA